MGEPARQHDRHHQVPNEGTVAERPFREVDPAHGGPFTTCPGARLCTPAMTMRSPAAMPAPATTVTMSSAREITVISRCATALLAGSTTQTNDLPPFSRSAVAGRSIRGDTGLVKETAVVMPNPHASGGLVRLSELTPGHVGRDAVGGHAR